MHTPHEVTRVWHQVGGPCQEGWIRREADGPASTGPLALEEWMSLVIESGCTGRSWHHSNDLVSSGRGDVRVLGRCTEGNA